MVNCKTSVNVRSGAGTTNSIIGQGKKNAQFTLLATVKVNGATWYKVQYTSVDSGPIQRTFGNATLHVSMMSSQGFRETVSGLFPPRDLERVPAEVMGRIRDGRYDHRRYE